VKRIFPFFAERFFRNVKGMKLWVLFVGVNRGHVDVFVVGDGGAVCGEWWRMKRMWEGFLFYSVATQFPHSYEMTLSAAAAVSDSFVLP